MTNDPQVLINRGEIWRGARQEFRATVTKPVRLANFRKTQKIRDDGLAAPVLVDPVGMQAVAAASRFQIDKGKRQIILAQEPGKYVQSLGLPFWVAVRLPGRQASRDRRGGFQWLLIEQARRGALVAKALCADGTENSRRRLFAGSQASAGIFKPAFRISRLCQSQFPSGAVLAAAWHCHKPDLPRTRPSFRFPPTQEGRSACLPVTPAAAPQGHCPGTALQ